MHPRTLPLVLGAALIWPAAAASRTDDELRAECRVEAAAKLGVEETLAVLDGTGDVTETSDGFVLNGNADLGDSGIRHFACRFDQSRALMGIDVSDPPAVP